MNEVNENEVYIPEYNPQKYKKAYKVTRIISIILFYNFVWWITSTKI